MSQTLLVVPSTSSAGGAGSLLVTLHSPPGKEPVGMQWRITLPQEMSVSDIAAGNAASAADMIVTCAAVKSNSSDQTYKCILVGGIKPIADGTIFLVKYRIRPGTQPQMLTVHLADVLAVWQQGDAIQEMAIPPVDGTITVR